jgi:hypothetical protein
MKCGQMIQTPFSAEGEVEIVGMKMDDVELPPPLS